jgi:hypothetical protein
MKHGTELQTTTMTDLRQQISEALTAFAQRPLADAAIALFETLGYRSEKRLQLGNTPEAFLDHFDRPEAPLNRERAFVSHWQTIDLLFQFTDDELTQERSLFGKAELYTGLLKSYLFFAIRLRNADYPRSHLAAITRAINRLFSIPVLILFAHGEKVSIAIINRRAHKREPSRDVLEKVSLIRDIVCTHPHRGQLDVLASFSLAALAHANPIRSFDDLHAAWAERLNIELLNRRFYQRIQEWFFWAAQSVKFPQGGIENDDLRNRIALIRMLTRIVFCWFARQKGLIPPELFTPSTARKVLKRFDPADATDGGYYLAILQNLFFPTLAVPLDQREFRNGRRYRGVNKHYMDHRFYRHERLFQDPEGLGALFERIPFLNGGLFECLDTGTGKADEVRVDGFSDEGCNQPLVPNVLFFGHEIHADLHDAYGSEKKRDVKVDGLFAILDAYTFTVTENTPVEEEIALDPELLGRIFENLLAEYNPETERTARKETGSFYTPRAIVDYMTGESLKAYLERELVRRVPRCSSADARTGLDLLFAYTEKEHPFDAEEQLALVDAVYDVRTFDPACGSGAFPMGMLQKLVFILEKLDRDHRRWKNRILDDTPPAMREDTRALLERSSAEHNWKLALIQHSIYGADIQPIAVQIAKLRCFISLLVDFKVDDQAENKGVPSLPNLDFKFVAANSLIPAPGNPADKAGDSQMELGLEGFFERFAKAAEEYYYVRDPLEKKKLRNKIEALIETKVSERENSVQTKRDELKRTVGRKAATEEGARKQARAIREAEAAIERADREVAVWRSYRNLFAFRNAPVGFFDMRYFFPEVKDGFDITIGNPPYVRADEPSEWNRIQRKAIMDSEAYEILWEKWDLFVPFIERAYKLLSPGGVSTMIVSDAFCHSKYAQKPQNWFLQNARILRLDFCSDLKIFDAAVHNLIYLFQKADGASSKPGRRLHAGEFGNVTLLPTDDQRKLTCRAFFPERGEQRTFGSDVILLDSICYISVGMVVHADEKVAHGAFELDDLVSEKRDKKHPKPFVEGKHLARWLPETNRWLEWGTDRAPGLFRRPTFPELYAVTEKLISVDMSAGVTLLRVAYDDERLLHNHSAWSFVPWHLLSGVRNNSLKKSARYKGERPPRTDLPQREMLESTSRRFDVKYLLAVMNSSVARDFLQANRRSNIHLYPDDWKKLPVPNVDTKAQAPIVKLVDKILAAKRADQNADIAELEHEVDSLVAALYGADKKTGKTAPEVQKDLKDQLREDVIPLLLSRQPYCSVGAIRAELVRRHIEFDRLTLNRYLVELREAGFLHDAGKGWYSSLVREFALDTKPLQEVIALLTAKYPLLSFACWSTEQIRNYVQHTLNKFVTFVYAEKDAVQPIFNALKSAGWDAYLDPKPTEARQTFVVRGRTVVVRSIRAHGVFADDHVLPIERLLLYLHLECRRLGMMDEGESATAVRRLIEGGRIDMGRLQSLADDHKVKMNDLAGMESTIAEE